MREYHKIHSLYKRDLAGTKKLIIGDWSLDEFDYLKNNQWEFTEKVDGTNIRVQFERVEDNLFTSFGGRTDKAEIPAALLERLNAIFLDEGLQQTLGGTMVERNINEIVFYGEGYGPKIQGGGKYRGDPGFVLFDVQVSNWWLLRKDVNQLGADLGLETVPVIGQGTLYDAVDWVRNGLTSQWGDFEAEGIVARPTVPLFDRKGGRIIAKIKGVDFL